MNKTKAILFVCLLVVLLGGYALLAPVFFPVRPNPAASACLSNLKRMATSVQMYRADHDDRLMLASSWCDDLKPYVGQEAFYSCPFVLEQDGTYGYAMNRFLSEAVVANLAEPAKAHLIYDTATLSRNANEYLPSFPVPGRDRGFTTIGFVDGHAERVKM